MAVSRFTSSTVRGIKNRDITSIFRAFFAAGGTETTAGGYKIHTFTSNSSLTITQVLPGLANAYSESSNVEYLVVAGGGGGGSGCDTGGAFNGAAGGSGIVIVRYAI